MEIALENNESIAEESHSESLIFQHQVKSSLDQLSEKCKELIRALYYVDPPLSYDDITAKYGIPFGSIGPTRARCLEKLKKILTAKG
jgi:DNA-directed RNA polymerase specialized sigma24 family protein